MEARHSLLPVVILLLCVSFGCFARFAVTPSSVTIDVEDGLEQEAVFRCRHERTDALIGWLINRTSTQQYPDVMVGNVLDINKNVVQTVAIPAIPRYNESAVVCVATFLDGSPHEETQPVALIISGSPLTLLATTDVLSTVSTITLSEIFELAPSSLTVAVEQGNATFKCRHLYADAINWRVNGVPLNIARLPNVTSKTQSEHGVLTYILSVGTLPEHNQSSIECVATFSDGSPSNFSEPAILLIQDIPEKVENVSCQRNYSSNALIKTWNPLFSLDINDIDPDIVYTDELFKITCGQNSLMNHTVVMMENDTQEGLDMMQIYRAVIAARNNVPEAMNGPSVEMNETFISLRGFILFNLVRNSQITLQSPNPVPSYYTMSLESLDGRGQDMFTNVSVERSGETINMHMSEHTLLSKSLWNAVIQAYGCEVHTEETELSTHDIQNVTVTTNSSLPGQIRIKGDFVDESTANGVFVIIYSLTDYSDIHYIAEQAEETIDMNIMDLSGTEYNVSVFSLENGRPLERVVTSTKRVNVTITGVQDSTASPQALPIEYDLQTRTNGVCITCHFMDLDGTLTDCLVVVHQQIPQLNSSGLMNIESSHRLTRSGDTAYGCVEGLDLKVFQVGVINGQMTSPTLIPNGKETLNAEAVIAGTTLGLVVFSLIAVLAAVILVRKFFKKRYELRAPEADLSSILLVQTDSMAMRGSVDFNKYVCAPRKEDKARVNEEEPSLLVPPQSPRPDTTLTECLLLDSQPMSESLERECHHRYVPNQEANPLSPDQTTPDNDTSDPTYAQPILPKSSKPVCPPVNERVVYDDVDEFQNKEGVLYAMTKFKSSSKGMLVDDMHQVAHSKAQPHLKAPTHTDPPPQPKCFTLELLSHLLPMASEWKSVGETLSLDEDLLDEVATSNETDEECLREMLERYMVRSDLKHNWEEIKAAEKMVKEESVPRDQVDNIRAAKTIPDNDHLKPATAYRMSQGLKTFNNLCGEAFETIDKMQPQSELIAEEDIFKERSVLVGIQESDSTSKASVIDGSNHVSCSRHTSLDPRESYHIITSDTAIPCVNQIAEFNEIHDGVDKDGNGIGTKWEGDTAAYNPKDFWHHKGNYPAIAGNKLLAETESVNFEDGARDHTVQESHEEITEYSVVLMRQLGIGEQRLSKTFVLGGDSSEKDKLLISQSYMSVHQFNYFILYMHLCMYSSTSYYAFRYKSCL